MSSQNNRKKVGNYYLVSQLGKGQFGTVYKGIPCDNQSKVYAIKCMNKEAIEKDPYVHKLFQTEVEVMTKINSPNILHLFEFIETVNNYYLVIQYCNNGDLEKYMEKVGKLPESQAIYFLMQIMNGFQVLNSHKIMHRDFKLANVFLNDDTVVIGDFGFAKKGVDVTKTKLGTPITMAPELLVGNGAAEYNNKADLWSIGIVFYQLLFNKLPFDVRSYDELKEKVHTQSGENLRFPYDTPVSNECKSLLKALLQSNPKNRIEWNHFFHHPVFESKKSEAPTQMNSARKLDVLNQSLFVKQNEEKVKREFIQNRNQPVEYAKTPEKIVVRKLQAKEDTIDPKELQNLDNAESRDAAFELIKLRYFNEKKKVIFMMFTVRKIRNLSKSKAAFGSLSERLMLTAVLLLHKATLNSDEALTGLEKGTNSFMLPMMKQFITTEDAKKILSNFLDDQKVYTAFNHQIGEKFDSEVTNTQFKNDWQRGRSYKFSEMTPINGLLWDNFLYLKDKISFLKLSSDQMDEYLMVLLHLYYSIVSESAFKPNSEGVFEWKRFEANLNPSHAQSILSTVK